MADDGLAPVRAAYARQTLEKARVTDDPALEAAFAAVRREDFLGPGPWQIVRFGKGYEPTPSADPVHLYTDDLFGLIPERGLNNGQPHFHAMLLHAAAIRPGDHVVHVGAGVGYYTALMAHLTGRTGWVTGIEYEPGLAARAAANFAAWPNVEIKQGDGATVPFAPADVIYVNAGATRPAANWLDNLKDGGRLILPLTVNRPAGPDALMAAANVGGVLGITRQGDDYPARWLSPTMIFPCAGMRDAAAEQVLAEAMGKPKARNITRLLRHPHEKDDRCIAHGDGWCLAID
ncbi:MAG: methyltransferase domain-containing protein [Alphaproteobacteria bacterium]|nr:methyltransferase domain-containing protein [Alphaproteobacteria bacterium]MBL6939199.1 methyltransferase domain-containing protein [Alphaproteobacteria bacterium]MBL7096715.1 methyltransferase domain-containing protein [Alphaproteobacteria bacterium]